MMADRILITGSSAGIGRALAEHYAAPGKVLGLVARRKDRLKALAAELEGKGARVFTHAADVCDREAMGELLRDFAKKAGGLDLVIANAGISERDHVKQGDPRQANEVININVVGAINTLMPAVPLMSENGGGHLVCIGSVAGYRGLPGSGAYCASKAAVRTLMDAWRPLLRASGIRVTHIAPGWVQSELTDKNPYKMPFIMSAEKAAGIIARAIASNKRNKIFPWQMRWVIVPLMRILPERLIYFYAATR